MLSSWQNFCPGSPNYGVIVIMVGKTKWKLLELRLPEGEKKKKKVKLKQCSIPGNCRDCPHQGVGGYDTVIPTIPITHLTSAENRS